MKRRFLVLATALFLLSLPARAALADELPIAVTQPWIALIVSFLGGPNVAVRPLLIWNDVGDPVRARAVGPCGTCRPTSASSRWTPLTSRGRD